MSSPAGYPSGIIDSKWVLIAENVAVPGTIG